VLESAKQLMDELDNERQAQYRTLLAISQERGRTLKDEGHSACGAVVSEVSSAPNATLPEEKSNVGDAHNTPRRFGEPHSPGECSPTFDETEATTLRSTGSRRDVSAFRIEESEERHTPQRSPRANCTTMCSVSSS
jgi:hypothetical protein